jgi:uncharacterized membrane protein YobD (UPF0266 family)
MSLSLPRLLFSEELIWFRRVFTPMPVERTTKQVLLTESQRYSLWLFVYLPAFVILKTVARRGDIVPTLVACILIAFFIALCELRTELREDGLQYQFVPFHLRWRMIPIDNISKIYVIKHSGLWGYYGSMGILSSGRDRAYHTQGKFDVQVVLTSGKKILFSTQKPDEWKKVIKERFAHLEVSAPGSSSQALHSSS